MGHLVQDSHLVQAYEVSAFGKVWEFSMMGKSSTAASSPFIPYVTYLPYDVASNKQDTYPFFAVQDILWSFSFFKSVGGCVLPWYANS